MTGERVVILRPLNHQPQHRQQVYLDRTIEHVVYLLHPVHRRTRDVGHKRALTLLRLRGSHDTLWNDIEADVLDPLFELRSLVRRFGFSDLCDHHEPLLEVGFAFKLGQSPPQRERMLLEVNHLLQLLVGNFDAVVDVENHASISSVSISSSESSGAGSSEVRAG